MGKEEGKRGLGFFPTPKVAPKSGYSQFRPQKWVEKWGKCGWRRGKMRIFGENGNFGEKSIWGRGEKVDFGKIYVGEGGKWKIWGKSTLEKGENVDFLRGKCGFWCEKCGI